MNKNQRIGEIGFDSYGERIEIIEYKSSINVTVKFENDYTTNTTYRQFQNGKIRNPYMKSVFNIGYIGEGKYKPTINTKLTLIYKTWKDMFARCYSKKYKEKFPTYKDCIIFDEWHNFQNFAKWYDENYYKIENHIMNLDKDILHKGNKIYSSYNCIFSPNDINMLFTKRKNSRGQYPIGVTWSKSHGKYTAQCNDKNSKRINLGFYDTLEQAFDVYKKYKEKLIKQIADEYKNKYPQFPQKLYDAMYNYVVEIED